MKHVQPKGDKQTGRGKRGRQMVRLLCSSGVSLILSGGVLVRRFFALQFPLVRVCFRPTFRLAFAPSGVLLGLILSAIAFAGGGFIRLLFRSPSSCPQRTIWTCLLVASWNFHKNSSRMGRRPFTPSLCRDVFFSPVYVCVLRLFRLNQSFKNSD